MTTLCVSRTEQAFWHLAKPSPPDILVYVCLLWQIYLEAFSSLFNWSLWPKYSGLHFSPGPRQCAELGLHVSRTEHQTESSNSNSLHTCKCFASIVFIKEYISFTPNFARFVLFLISHQCNVKNRAGHIFMQVLFLKAIYSMGMKGKYIKIQDEWRELHESEQIILLWRLIQSDTKCCVNILTFLSTSTRNILTFSVILHKNLQYLLSS